MAVTKSWKEPLEGAMATLPAKRSSVSSSTESGSSASRTSSEL